MNKIIVSSVIALSLLAASPALAQSYYAGGCTSVATGLGIGASGSSVSSLQAFLVAQNYPGGGAWMETGYFGAATATALRNFQAQHGLPQSGMVDASTVSAISSASCGGNAVVSQVYPSVYPTIPLPYQNYVTPSYPYPYNYYNGAPTITSLSQNTGTPGQTITIYGVGFDSYNNTVNFGGTVLSGIPSTGTSLSVTVPSYYYSSYGQAGSPVQLTVSDSRGTSNALTFTLYGGSTPITCGTYPYVNCNGGCNNYYPYYSGYQGACGPQNTSAPTISYLSPTSGAVGTSVTIFGSGFTTTGNSVRFGSGVIANINSTDGRTLSFVVPTQLNGYGNQPITLSTYQVSVQNGAGYTTNAQPFIVTSLGSYNQPTITSVNGPTSLSVGQQGTWSFVVGSGGTNYMNVTVSWGDQNTYGAAPATQQAYTPNQTVSLTHTYYQAGTYQIVFMVSNSAGQSNSYTTSITVSGATTYSNSTVSIANMAFNPQIIYIQRGTTVTWTNNDTVAHTVTSDNNFFGSGLLNPGQTYLYTFNTPGTYTYHCSIHPQMTGTIIVQ